MSTTTAPVRCPGCASVEAQPILTFTWAVYFGCARCAHVWKVAAADLQEASLQAPSR